MSIALARLSQNGFEHSVLSVSSHTWCWTIKIVSTKYRKKVKYRNKITCCSTDRQFATTWASGSFVNISFKSSKNPANKMQAEADCTYCRLRAPPLFRYQYILNSLSNQIVKNALVTSIISALAAHLKNLIIGYQMCCGMDAVMKSTCISNSILVQVKDLEHTHDCSPPYIMMWIFQSHPDRLHLQNHQWR